MKINEYNVGIWEIPENGGSVPGRRGMIPAFLLF
jgi:hypothetical protein